MSTGLPLFDDANRNPTTAAEQRRDAGIAASSRNAGELWKQYAIDWITEYARSHREIKGDDIWNAGLQEPATDRRALGAVLKALQSNGIIAPDGFYRSNASNRSPKVKWKSLVFER